MPDAVVKDLANKIKWKKKKMGKEDKCAEIMVYFLWLIDYTTKKHC